MTASLPPHLRPGAAALGADPEFADIYAALSTAPDRAGVSRRHFLQGALAVGGAAALSGGPWARAARAATAPLGTGDTILVVILLGGGNDGINMVVPTGDAAYARLRPNLSVANGAHPLGAGGLSFHPALGRLAARYANRKVAVVRGVGDPGLDHSHFSSMATWMAGTAGPDRTSGWLGRYLDGLPDGEAGLRAVTMDSSVPLHLLGRRAQVSALGDTAPFGSVRTSGAEVALIDGLRSFGAGGSGLGRWGDAVGALNRSAVDRAREFSPLYGADLPAGDLTRQLELAARVVNLNVGVRVLGATFGSFDTHDDQRYTHHQLMVDLDRAVDRFYATLHPAWAGQVVLMTFSEFGRRATENGSGTDHGTAAPMLVIGDRVRGGLYGTQPSLTDLDRRGDLRVTTDFRSVYASVLGGWLGADPKAVLGGTYADLPLFASRPTAPPPPPALPRDPRFAPFADAGRFVDRQYADFLDKVPSAANRAAWLVKLRPGASAIAPALDHFYRVSPYAGHGVDVARLVRCGTGEPPSFDDFRRWTAQRVAGGSMVTVAAEVVASGRWRARYATRWGRDLVERIHVDATGVAPTAAFVAAWEPKVRVDAEAGSAALLAAVSSSAAARARWDRASVVVTVFAAMLRRTPNGAGADAWAAKLAAGTSRPALLKAFYGTPEYRTRVG